MIFSESTSKAARPLLVPRSLYHYLSDVYYPLLGISQQDQGTPASASKPRDLDLRMRELLLQVQAGLGSAVQSQGGSRQQQPGNTDPASAPLDAILQPLDELDFWAQLAATDRERRRIAACHHMLDASC